MASLGEVILKFGAMGESGEQTVRFQTGHINLLVGPNNAGKSLMLRELSGVNPRASRSRTSSSGYPETHIVASVGWSDKSAQGIKDEIIKQIFEEPNEHLDQIKSRSWTSLVCSLEQIINQLTKVRNCLSSSLLELLKSSMGESLVPLAPFIRSTSGLDWKEGGRLMILGAVALLAFARTSMERSAQEQSIVPLGEPQGRPDSPLSKEQADVLQGILETSWKQCQEILAPLGVDTADLTVESLCDGKSLASVLLQKASAIPGLGQLIVQDSRITQLPTPDDETIRRFERYMIVGGWLLDPKPLEAFIACLRDGYVSRSWADSAHRAYMAKCVLYLDGLGRLEMTRSIPLRSYDEGAEDAPPILSLLKQPEAMQRLRTLVATALGRHLVIDMVTQAPLVIWRLADEAPAESMEGSYSKAARDYHSNAALLDERSDGIHAFIGMLAAIIAKSIDVVFIDEPEAFLHPPLVRKLARQLVAIAKESDRQFFIATHSADLLESCAAVGAEVNIIRLTHNNDRSTARLLDGAKLRELALDPLLRAESTLSALFHEGAVVCEAVADRVLYREINERLLLSDDKEGLESCVFLNAQNWQTVARMIAPLRKMGVAAAAILDADVLFGSELSAILYAAQIPKILREGWLQQRTKLKDKLVKRLQPADGKLDLKGHTIAKLSSTEAKIFKTMRSAMAEYGVFLVPVGELEDWLSHLGLKRSAEKSKWLRAALDQLGIDPEAEGYARPTGGDIWQFMREVNRWILDPRREGTSPTSPEDD